MWLVCKFDVIDRSVNKCAALACQHAKRHVGKEVPVLVAPSGGDARNLNGRNQQPVLVDIAEFVHNPQRMPFSTLVCLHLIDEEILDDSFAGSKASVGPHLSGEARCVVGKWEASTACLACG